MNIIKQAFGKDEKLLRNITQAQMLISDASDPNNPLKHHTKIFEQIAAYHLQHATSATPTSAENALSDEPAAKKRKLNGAENTTTTTSTTTSFTDLPHRDILFTANDISFSIPVRRKCQLNFIRYSSHPLSPNTDQVRNSNTTTTIITVQALDAKTQNPEFEIPLNQLSHALKVPVPEKAQKQYNYTLVPKTGSGVAEPVLWTLPAGPLKSAFQAHPSINSFLEQDAGAASNPGTSADDRNELGNVLAHLLSSCQIPLSLPNPQVFKSATPEPHRKNEPAYHVRCYRGSKEGYLFFLKEGIFFGFKKPLFWVGLEQVVSVSFTSVLARTFNLVVGVIKEKEEGEGVKKEGGKDIVKGDVEDDEEEEDEVEEVEFSMLDQSDYAGIDDYVRRNGLNDASLAGERKAKVVEKKGAAGGGAARGVNGSSTEKDGPHGLGANGIKQEDENEEEDDGLTDLQRAEQRLQDEEDEMEEDFDPDAEDEDGESGSEGGSDEDDDDDDDDDDDGGDEKEGAATGIAKGRARRGRGDVVEEALGNEAEAEDVEVVDDEGEGGEVVDGEGEEFDEEEEFEEEEEQEEEVVDEKPTIPKQQPPQQRSGFAAMNAPPAFATIRGKHMSTMPDPDDDDQL